MTYGHMDGVQRSQVSPNDMVVVTICPNAVLASAAFVGLFFITALGPLGALLFLGAGLGLFVLSPRASVGALVDSWWILILPLWCLITFAWSDHPDLTLRHGIQLSLTVAIGIAMAARLSPYTLLRALFAAGLLAALASLAFGRHRLDGGGYLGIYASKNDLAFSMLLFFSAATALALGRDVGGWLRLLAGAGMGLGMLLIVMAQSVGWLGGAFGILFIGTSIAVLRHVDLSLRLLTVGLGILAVLVVAVFLSAYSEQLLAIFTEVTGRDATFTGRTLLWQTARDEIALTESLGRGYDAYWVPGNRVAEEMWQEFGIESRSGFHFHNTWLTNWVEIGAVGIAIQITVFGLALLGSIHRALVAPRAESVFFAMLLVVLLGMSFAELVFFRQFHTGTVVVVAAAVFANRARMDPRAVHSMQG